MTEKPQSQGLPKRETGNWSGKQDKLRRPGNENVEQAGQREYTEPSVGENNSSRKAR
jgi:hypothetical protein